MSDFVRHLAERLWDALPSGFGGMVRDQQTDLLSKGMTPDEAQHLHDQTQSLSNPFSQPPGTQWLKQARQPSDAQLSAQGQQATAEIPVGPLKVGQSRFLPNQFSRLGNTRPLGPGEAVQLQGGGITSEETYTQQMPNGQWAVIPGLWLINGVPTKVSPEQATQLAVQSGLTWTFSFPSEEQADAYATHREAVWERTPQALDMTTSQPALWAMSGQPTGG